MSIVQQISTNTFAIRELEAAIGELRVRCERRDRENAELLAELEATSQQLYAMWKIISDPEAITDDTVASALAADLNRRSATEAAVPQHQRPGAAAAVPAAVAEPTPAPAAQPAPPRGALPVLPPLPALPPQPPAPEVVVAAPKPPAPAPAPPPPPAAAAPVASVAVAPVVAPTPVKRADFTGTWALSQSINFGPYLEATGVSWAKRQIAVKLKPVQDWALVSEDVWEFSMNTPIGKKVERIVINGAVDDEIDGLQVVKESFWEENELVTRCRPRDATKKNAPTEFRRRHDAATDQLILEIVTGPARCTRIFERQR